MMMLDLLCNTIPDFITIMKTTNQEKVKLELDNTRSMAKAQIDTKNIPLLTNRMVSECRRLSNGKEAAEKLYTAAAIETMKLIKWCIYYMTTPGVKLINANESEKSFINAISDFVGFGKIFRESYIADLDWYDAKQQPVASSPKFLMSIDDLEDIRIDPEFDMKWRTKLQNSSIEIKEGGKVTPIFSFEELNVPKEKKPEDMTDAMFKFFEQALYPFLDDVIYWYDIINGVPTLCIDRGNSFVSTYMLDNGTIMGGADASILGMYENPQTGWTDTCFVKIKNHPDIVRNMINNSMYIMGSEAAEVFRDFFNNTLIYHNIDFSNSYFIRDMDGTDLWIFERALTACLKVMDDDFRYRFLEYKEPRDFKLIADKNAVSPLSASGSTACINDTAIEYHIDFEGNRIRKYSTDGAEKIYNVEFTTNNQQQK